MNNLDILQNTVTALAYEIYYIQDKKGQYRVFIYGKIYDFS